MRLRSAAIAAVHTRWLMVSGMLRGHLLRLSLQHRRLLLGLNFVILLSFLIDVVRILDIWNLIVDIFVVIQYS